MKIEIKPYDLLFFRDGKPFMKGENYSADIIFPPFPSTVYGTLRTSYFSDNIDVFRKLKSNEKLNSEDDPTTNLKINKIIVKKDDSFLFPLPRDLVFVDNENEQKKEKHAKILKLIRKREMLNTISNDPMEKSEYFLYTDEKNISNYKGYLKEKDFVEYLKGSIDNKKIKILKMENIYQEVSKIGNHINENRVVSDSSEGGLYRESLLRLKKDVSLVVDFEGFKISDKGYLKLGGEGRVSNYQKIEREILTDEEIKIKKGEYFKIVFLTPSIFNNGWKFSFDDAEFIQASVGKAKYVGGFDIDKNRSKEMRKAVPIGSVYYFKAKKDMSINRFGKISNYLKKEGFGSFVLTKINQGGSNV